MKKILMIDDKKDPNCMIKDNYADSFQDKYFTEGEIHCVRTYREGLEELKKKGWETLLLDHDLGGIKTGYDILCWLEEHLEFLPKTILLITNNPVGLKRMVSVLQGLESKGLIENWDINR